MFKNTKIQLKLSLAFTLMILFLIVSMVFSIFNLNKFSKQMQYIVDETIPAINTTWTGRRAMVAMERSLFLATSTTDPIKMQGKIKEAQSEIKVIEDTVIPFLREHYTENSKKVEDFANMMTFSTRIRERIFDKALSSNNAEALKIMEDEYLPHIQNAANLLIEISEDIQNKADTYAAQARKANGTAIFMLITISVFCFVFSSVICVLLTKSILRPLNQIKDASRKMANGTLQGVDITYYSKNELGEVCQSLRETIHVLNTYIHDMTTCLGKMSDGNFDIQVENDFRGDFIVLKEAITKIAESLSISLSQINESSQQVDAGSDQVSNGAQALSQGASEQASAIEELSATIEDISNKIKANAENALNAKNISEAASREVTRGNEEMQSMIQAMQDISVTSSEISKIIKTIDDIAFQTNILALNAAVEAARAGSAGKGFAVVADEVRNLASKSADAAQNTTVLIENCIRAVNNGKKIADKTAASLLSIVDGAQKSVQLIEEISAASNQQANAVVQVTQGMEQISAVVQTNSATAEESAAASQELSSQAQILKKLVSQFVMKNSSDCSMVEDTSLSYEEIDQHSENQLIYASNEKY